MKNLTNKSNETLSKLNNKANDGIWHEKAKHRMPTLKSISKLLTELNIEHDCDFITRTTNRSGTSTNPIHTSTGTANGTRLKIKGTRIDIDTTQSWHCHRTGGQQESCQDIINFIKNR